MGVFQAASAGGAVAEMPHVDLSYEWREALYFFSIGFIDSCGDLRSNGGENLVDGSCAERAFAEYVLVAGGSVEFYHTDACGFLSAVVLLFHQQIEAVKTVGPGAVFGFIVFQRFEQAYHCHTAFVFQCFHFGIVWV